MHPPQYSAVCLLAHPRRTTLVGLRALPHLLGAIEDWQMQETGLLSPSISMAADLQRGVWSFVFGCNQAKVATNKGFESRCVSRDISRDRAETVRDYAQDGCVLSLYACICRLYALAARYCVVLSRYPNKGGQAIARYSNP